MKPRTLSVHRISEEQLRRLMHVVQGICLHENGYCVCRCDGWSQAVAVLEGYLRGNARKETGM